MIFGVATTTTTWHYDKLGPLVSRETTTGSESSTGGGGPVTYTYDKASNLTSTTSSVSGTVTCAYDAAGVPTSVTYPKPTAGLSGVMRFTLVEHATSSCTPLK